MSAQRWQWVVLAVLLVWALPALGQAASVSGSWVAQAEGVRVAVAGRDTLSRPLAGSAAGAQIARVAWQYTAPPGAPLEAWLCHPQRCVRLDGPRGRSEVLAGLSAAEPLRFRFRLAQQGRPLQVNGLQVIVDYRRESSPKE